MKQCICNQLTDIVEEESIKNFQDKIAPIMWRVLTMHA